MKKYLKDLSIRFKILIPVSILGIMMIIIGLMGIYGQNSIISESDLIIDKHVNGVETIANIAEKFQSLRRVSFTHIVACSSKNTELMQNLENERQEFEDAINSSSNQYNACIVEESDKTLLSQFKEEFTAYVAIVDKIITADQADDFETAIQLANTDLREAEKNLTAFIDDFMQSKEEAIAVSAANQVSTANSSRIIILTLLGIGALFFAFTVWVSWTWCCKRLINIKKQLIEIIDSVNEGRGDLTKRVQSFCIDEIGSLSANINVFIEMLHNIMSKINGSTNELNDIVGLVSEKVSQSNGNSIDTSSLMQEMSASMEEISSTIMEIKGSIEFADNNVKDLSDESNGLSQYASDMENRASDLETNAIENKDNTESVVKEITESLKKAIEKSKSVEQVNELTDEILEISGKTNLLALNASIEAARAGDAGRGFAVVAGEIGTLANSSKETASNIQNINNMVVNAVHDLINASNKMLTYVDETIMPDYENFVSAGSRYKEDSVYVNGIVTKFNQMSSDLRELLNGITNSITGIANSVEDCSMGVTNAASNTSELVKGIEDISSAMQNNKDVAVALESEASRFINLL